MNQSLSRAAFEWRWFFHSAKSEIGIRSSWEPLVQVALVGGNRSAKASGTSEGEERRRLAIRRHARVEAALRAMDGEHVSLIRLACEDEVKPLRVAYGDLGNAAHLTEAAEKAVRASRSTLAVSAWLDKLARKYALGRAGAGGLDAIEGIRLGLEDYFEPVRCAYVQALGRLPMRAA